MYLLVAELSSKNTRISKIKLVLTSEAMKKGEELALSSASVLLEIRVNGYNSTITLLHSDGPKVHRVLAHLSAIRLNRRELV